MENHQEIGTFFVRTGEGGNPQTALNKGHFCAAGMMLVLSYFVIDYMSDNGKFVWDAETTYEVMDLFLATVVGLASGILIGLFAEYYTSDERKPAQDISKASEICTSSLDFNWSFLLSIILFE